MATLRSRRLETLVIQAGRHANLIRLLLLTRIHTSLRIMPDTLPQLARVETLAPVGEAGDRQRWFAEASRAYARVWRVPPPDLPIQPVGRDADTPLVLHARALLMVLGRAGIGTWSLTDIVTELVILEQRTWSPDLDRLPGGCDGEILAQAVTVLLILPAPSVEAAADLLQRVPQFAHDAAHESRVAVARWAHRRYPPGPGHRLSLRPHLVAERLVLNTLTPQLLHDDDISNAAPELARAYATFPDALTPLIALLARPHSRLPDALAGVLATGVTSPALDRALAALIDTNVDADTQTQLLTLVDIPATFPHLLVAQAHLRIARLRELVATDPNQYHPSLAASLQDLGIQLRDMGKQREALAATYEAVAILSDLARTQPHRYYRDLTASLHNVSGILHELGKWREALVIAERTVAIWRELVEVEPDRHHAELAKSLHGLGIYLAAVGKTREALATSVEAEAIWRSLATEDPDQHRPHLATSLHKLGVDLYRVGNWREALVAAEQAVAMRRELDAADPDLHRHHLAQSLDTLGSTNVPWVSSGRR